MSQVRVGLVAALVLLAVLVTSAGSATGLAPDKMFTIEYSGTVAESAQPNAVPGNIYSENITFDLKVTGTPEQLATGRATSNLTASATVTGTSVVWSKHTICGGDSWFVKIDAKHALTHSAVFFHPNAAGQKELEQEILEKIGG